MNGANPFAGLMSSVPNFAQNMGQTMPSGQTNMQANPMVPAGPTPAALQQQVQLLSMLQAQGVPQDQWAPLLQVLMQAGAAGGAPNAAAPSGYGGYGRDDPSRDRNGYNDQYNMRSPSGRYRDRSRSRSPGGYGRRRDSPPRRRDSPTYGDYGRGGSRRQGPGQNGGRDYRQRSPQDRYRRSDSPRRQEQTLPPPGPKRLEFDHSLPPNHIKGRSHVLPSNKKIHTDTRTSPQPHSLRWRSHVSQTPCEIALIISDVFKVQQKRCCAESSTNLA